MDYADIKTVLLQVGRYASQIAVDELMLMNTPQIYVEREIHGWVVRMLQRVAKEELLSVRYPTNWKESFKERWFPAWLLKKYPVKYVEINAQALYPKISLPDHSPVIKMYKTEVEGVWNGSTSYRQTSL